jgi:uncharacterized protein YdaU (DUF1376 family)
MGNTKQVWFRHDIGTMNDKQIIRILRKHGMEGIGIYWYLVEALYEADGYIPFDYLEEIAFSTHVEQSKIEAIIKTSGLFKYDKKLFWSERALKEIGISKDKSEKAKEAAYARWHNQTEEEDTTEESMQTHIDSNADAKQSNSVRNAQTDRQTDRQRERGDSQASRQTSPSPFSKQREACGTHKNILLSKEEYTALCNRFGKDNTRAYINKVSTYMQSKGKTYADHYATVQQWLEDDIAKGQIRLPSAEPVMPTKCDKCGKPLVDGKCVSCNRRVYGEGGSYHFEDIPDPTEIQRFAEKMRSFA